MFYLSTAFNQKATYLEQTVRPRIITSFSHFGLSVRATGRFQIRSLRLVVRTLASHAGDRGSSPLGSARFSNVLHFKDHSFNGDTAPMRYLLLALLTSFLFVSACSDNKVEEHVWKEQTDTIEKAKDVEQLILDTTNQRMQGADEQSR